MLVHGSVRLLPDHYQQASAPRGLLLKRAAPTCTSQVLGPRPKSSARTPGARSRLWPRASSLRGYSSEMAGKQIDPGADTIASLMRDGARVVDGKLVDENGDQIQLSKRAQQALQAVVKSGATTSENHATGEASRAARKAAAPDERKGGAGATRAQPKSKATTSMPEAGASKPDAAGAAAKPAPAMRNTVGGTSGQPARTEQASQPRAPGQPGRASRFAPKRITIRLEADEDSTQVICATTDGRVVLQLAVRVSQEEWGAGFNQLPVEQIATGVQASLQSLEGGLSLPVPVVSYVPFKKQVNGTVKPATMGAYIAQLTVPARTATAVRAALCSPGRMPSVDVPLDGERTLSMTLVRPGSNPVDTAFNSARVPRLIRVEAKDEVNVYAVAEVLRRMRTAGLVGGVGWVGYWSASSGEPGLAWAFPEATMGALDLYTALREQEPARMQLPSGVPGPAPGVFVALAWGLDKELLQAYQASMELQLCPSPALANSSLHGRTEVPFTLSHVHLRAAPTPKPNAKPPTAGSSYAAALDARTSVSKQPPDQVGVDEAQEETGRVAREVHVLEKQLDAAIAEAASSKAQLLEVQTQLKAVTEQLAAMRSLPANAAPGGSMGAPDPAGVMQPLAGEGVHDAEGVARQLHVLQEQLASAQAEAQRWKASMQQEVDDARTAMMVAVEDAQRAEKALKKLDTPIRFPTPDPARPPTAASTKHALLDRCASIIEQRVLNQQLQVPGKPTGDALKAAVTKAAQQVCEHVGHKWGMEEVAGWIQGGTAAPGTFTDMALLSFLPRGWDSRTRPTPTSPSRSGHATSSMELGSPPTRTAATLHPTSIPSPVTTVLPGTLEPAAAASPWALAHDPDAPKKLVYNSTRDSVLHHMLHNTRLLVGKRRPEVASAVADAMAQSCLRRLTLQHAWETMRVWLMQRKGPDGLTEDAVWALMQGGAVTPPTPHA